MDFATVKTAGIIGAGVAGLATARSLKDAGVQCTIFERNSQIGGVWTDGYLDYGVQVPMELYEFPDFPLPAETPTFTPGPALQEYLESYARHFGIMDLIELNTNVVKLDQPDGKGEWRVTVERDGERHTNRFDMVVVCVGLYSNIPHMPEIPGEESFEGCIYHISDFKNIDVIKDRKVAVLGFGKSATDAALAASVHGAASHIIARTLHWPIPRNLAGILPFKWGLLNRFTLTTLPPYKEMTPLEARVHSIGKPLVWLYWRVVEALLVVQCGLWSRFGTRPSFVPDEPAEIGAFSEATMVPRPGFYQALRSGAINLHRGSIARFTAKGVELTDGDRLDADTVIMGTGWRSDYGYMPDVLQKRLGFADDGIYLYRQILHPDAPGLAFVGYASTVSNILCYAMQAHWLAGLVEGKHELPDAEKQRTEIQKIARWKRSWMPDSHARAARLIAHLPHYLDELCLDLGINPLRKKGVFAPLAEVFAPYQPSDYRDVFEKTG